MISEQRISTIRKAYEQTKSLRRTARICGVAINTVRHHCQDIINSGRVTSSNIKDIYNTCRIETPATQDKKDTEENIYNNNIYNNILSNSVNDNNYSKSIISQLDLVISRLLSNFNLGTYDLATVTPYQASLILGILIDKKIALSGRGKEIVSNQSVIFNFFGKGNIKEILEEIRNSRKKLQTKGIPTPPD